MTASVTPESAARQAADLIRMYLRTSATFSATYSGLVTSSAVAVEAGHVRNAAQICAMTWTSRSKKRPSERQRKSRSRDTKHVPSATGPEHRKGRVRRLVQRATV